MTDKGTDDFLRQTDEKYMLGVTVKEALGITIRLHHELHDIVMALQDRVLQLELKALNK
jgi:hypothetical protein